MADRPNIVFLFPDQLRRDFLSCYGADFIDTPNIDSIAAAVPAIVNIGDAVTESAALEPVGALIVRQIL